MFPSLVTMSYDKFDQEFVTRVFEDRQTFRVTFYAVRQCFLVWPGLNSTHIMNKLKITTMIKDGYNSIIVTLNNVTTKCTAS